MEKNKPMTQERAVLDYLLAGHSITPLEALQKFGCLRLSAIIYDLRAMCYDIVTMREKHTDKFGHEKRYARYVFRALEIDRLKELKGALENE